MKQRIFRFNSLQSKIVFISIAGILVMFIFLIIYMREVRQRRVLNLLSDYHLELTALEKAPIENYLNRYILSAQQMANSLVASKTDSLAPMTRAQVNHLLKSLLTQDDHILGIGTIWEPNAFDNKDEAFQNQAGHDLTGAFIPYWHYTNSGDIIQQPFSDYYIRAFYLNVKETISPFVADPEPYPHTEPAPWISTIATPLFHRGEFLGVCFIQVDVEPIIEAMQELEKQHPDNDFSLFATEGTIVHHAGAANIIGQTGNVVLNNFSQQLKSIQSGPPQLKADGNRLEIRMPVIFHDAGLQWQLRRSFTKNWLLSQYQGHVAFNIITFLVLFLLVLIEIWIIRRLLAPIQSLAKQSLVLAEGNTHISMEVESRNIELITLSRSFNKVTQYLKRLVHFASELKKGNYDAHFEAQGASDELGQTLIALKENLKEVQNKEIQRKQEDAKVNWVNVGLARFNDILHKHYENIEALAYNIMRELINYMDVVQGGLFIMESEWDDNHTTSGNQGYLELKAAIAFDEEKHRKVSFALGEGLVGNCALERKTIYLKKIPDDYLAITSGLGDAPPENLLLVPLMIKDEVYGVVEIASFNEIEDYKKGFLEKLAESIATTLSSTQINEQTKQLLVRSKQQTEEMAAQEEEMRQNLEELTATQEELQKNQADLHALNQIVDIAFQRLEFSPKGIIKGMNDNLLKLTGFEKADLLEHDYKKLLDKTKFAEFDTIWNSLLAGNDYHGQVKWIKKDGELLWNLATYVPVFNAADELDKVFYVGMDITRSKELEEKIYNLRKDLEAEQLQVYQLEEAQENLKNEYQDKERQLQEQVKHMHEEIERLKKQS